MSLPKLTAPTFTLKLPSNGQKISFRPFLVKEEKVLLIAQESKDEHDILQAIKQVLTNCVLSDIDIGALPIFDIEYFFIKLRAKSVNNIASLKFRDKEDGRPYEFDVDLDQLEPVGEVADGKIQLTDDVGVELRYPSLNTMEAIVGVADKKEQFNKMLVKCIKTLWDAETTYDLALCTPEEIDEFISSLSIPQMDKIKAFFDNVPKLHHEIKYANSKGNERHIVLEGLNDFFQ